MVMNKIKEAQRAKTISKNDNIEKLIAEALSKNIINQEEANLVLDSEAAIYDAVQVDEYGIEEYKKAH